MNSGGFFQHRTEEGAVAVETGIFMSVLVLLIVGALEIADAWWTYNTILLAVGDAARYAMIHSNNPPLDCGAQIAAPLCPAPSNTPLANCAAARAQLILSMYQTANVIASVTENAGSTSATATVCASVSRGTFGPQLLPDLGVTLSSRTTVPLI